MVSLQQATTLARQGHFEAALEQLPDAQNSVEDQAAILLKAELLYSVGRLEQSRALVIRLLKSKQLQLSETAGCEWLLGELARMDGDNESAVIRFTRSASASRECNSLEWLCRAQLQLLLTLSLHAGSDAATALINDIRNNVIRTGSPSITATLHIQVAGIEGSRGLLRNARRHLRLARTALSPSPNSYLEARIKNGEAAIALLVSDCDAAFRHASSGVLHAEQSGAALTRDSLYCNLGLLSYMLGEFEEASKNINRGSTVWRRGSYGWCARMETLARVKLAEGNIDECERLLDEIDLSHSERNILNSYVLRQARLTRTKLLVRQRNLDTALDLSKSVLTMAESAEDHSTKSAAELMRLEVLQVLGTRGWFFDVNSDLLARLGDEPDQFAQYERILACALATDGDLVAAWAFYERAKRILTTIRHIPESMELDRCWKEAAGDRADTVHSSIETDTPKAAARRTMSDISALLLYSGRAELVARNLLELLVSADCAYAATALREKEDGTTDVLAHIGAEQPPADSNERRLSIGTIGDDKIELVVYPKPDVESVATLNAIEFLLAIVHDREQAQAEREERATLWPIDELPTDDGRAVATGHMREQLNFAKKIARTTVTVLISGESGTGKEILARAIHTHSDRVDQPFIAFNCAAIPRDLVESQLFGHRRGSFTGADRENQGVIQSAKGGTLFLDEIGELSFDLQPKLLRFLESGEICPVGESTPFSVDVRIVAATNANLDALVKDGRFREDLFYRLNVVRLSIKPLRERRDEIPGLAAHFVARAAEEFRKQAMRIADETMERLVLYSWPGNVRQLQNELRRMVALAEPNSVLVPTDLSPDIYKVTTLPAPDHLPPGSLTIPRSDKLPSAIARIEREMIKAALRDSRGKVDEAARALGISRKGLYLKRQRLGL